MKKDIVSQLLLEAQAYRQFEDIERLVESGADLAAVPVQPLFVALRATSQDQVAKVLPRMNPDQRQALVDIDLWHKDQLDPEAANWWLEVYARCPDEYVRAEFARSEDFLLALKSQCEVYTFDPEDPEYPDHDSFFITEDQQLLVAYPEDCPWGQELQRLVKDLYTQMGPEHAYAHLLKMVSDSWMVMEEENYQRKKERLRDYGFVDYYEALAMDAVFPSEEAARGWLKGRTGATGEVDGGMRNQALHASALVPYQKGLDGLKDALASVADARREDFLHFSFVRLVNARLTADEALKGGAVSMARSGSKARQRLELGFAWAAREIGGGQVFAKLDFADLHKLGNTLLEGRKKQMKKALAATPFEHASDQAFLGMYWNAFLENALDEPVKLKVDGSSPPAEVRDMEGFGVFAGMCDGFTQMLPFIVQTHKSLQAMLKDNRLHDSFYLNYAATEIDFEAVMLSSFINFTLGHFDRAEAAKMGVRVDELKEFYRRFFVPREGEWLLNGSDPALLSAVEGFATRFGFGTVPFFGRWLTQVMVEQLNGYDIGGMDDEEFKHLGGPVLLVPAVN